jgi:hypothetical protein
MVTNYSLLARYVMKTPPAYATSEISRAFGIPISTLNEWAQQGHFRWLSSSSLSSPGQGRGRRFEVEDVLQLRLMQLLDEVGVPMREAAFYANLAMRAIDDSSPEYVGELSIRYFPDGKSTEVRFADSAMDVPATPGAVVTIKIDLVAAFYDARDRFLPDSLMAGVLMQTKPNENELVTVQ